MLSRFLNWNSLVIFIITCVCFYIVYPPGQFDRPRFAIKNDHRNYEYWNTQTVYKACSNFKHSVPFTKRTVLFTKRTVPFTKRPHRCQNDPYRSQTDPYGSKSVSFRYVEKKLTLPPHKRSTQSPNCRLSNWRSMNLYILCW